MNAHSSPFIIFGIASTYSAAPIITKAHLVQLLGDNDLCSFSVVMAGVAVLSVWYTARQEDRMHHTP